MSFVFPTLLAGLVVTGVPLLLHLIMRRKPKRQPFPAFRYLVKRHRTNQRRLRLRHLLLLALRVGLILLICLALARPRALNERLQLSSDRALAAVFVFDTSYSMEYAVGNRSRLDEAKRRALEFLDQLPEGSRVAVLDSAENVQSGKGEWLASLVQARERINRLRLKPANYPVTTRLQSAYRLFAELAQGRSPEQNLPRLLCVFSDRTLASWDAGKLPELFEIRDAVPPPVERLQQFRDEIPALLDLLGRWPPTLSPAANQTADAKSLSELLEKLRDHVANMRAEDYPDRPTVELLAKVNAATRGVVARVRQVDDKAEPAVREYRDRAAKALQEALTSLRGVHELFVDVGAERPDDLAIVGLELPRLAVGDHPKQVFNADETIRLQAVVQATGRDFSQMLVAHVDQKKLPTLPSVELKAGEKQSVRVEIDVRELKLSPGPHQIEVRLAAPDAMPFNNSRLVTFLIRDPRKVLIITDEPDRAEPWSRALELLGKGPFRCEVVKADSEKVRADYLAPFSAVYLMNVSAPSKELWEALENYVQRGGGLGVIPGQHQMKKEAYDEPAARRLLPGQFEFVASSEDSAGDPWELHQIRETSFQHPFLSPFREWRNDKTIDFIRFPRRATYYWVVKPANETDVLVRYKGNKKRPALLEYTKVGAGKVLLFTTPLHLQDEPWNNYLENITSFYVMLATQVTNRLAGDLELVTLNFTSGQQSPSLPLSLVGRQQGYQLRGPSLTETVSVGEEQTAVQFPQAVAPGNYAVDDLEGRPLGLFSVNTPPEESLLEQVPAEQIEALFGPRSVVPINYRTDLLMAISGHWRQPLELFPILMVALLLLLALENLLSNKFYRRDPAAEKEGP
jgi:hypothetical protein